MFKVGDIVRYKNGWCSDGERKYLHIVREVRLNPVTNQMTRYLIETVNMEHMTLNPTETVDECMIEYAEAEETKGDNTMISIDTIKAIAKRVRGEKTNLWRAAQGEDEILASTAWSDRTWAEEVIAHCEAGTLTERDEHFAKFFGTAEELAEKKETAEVAEKEEETNTMTNTNTNTNININEKENDTMTTNNTINETITETDQQKTDRENWEHCKSIALTLDRIAEGSAYKCPHCGEIIFWSDDQYDDDEATYTCPECGETFDECDLEPFGIYDYFSDCYDIEYRIGSDKQFRSVRLLVAYGGPNIYIDTASGNVELYWWTDRASYALASDTIDAINAEFEELYACC